MPIIQLGDEIPTGVDYLAGELAGGRSGLWCGRGPAGFSLMTACLRARDVAGGKLIGLSFTPAQLRQLYVRIGELLGERVAPNQAPIDGIRLGDTPKGD